LGKIVTTRKEGREGGRGREEKKGKIIDTNNSFLFCN
jgi:hypothetical protein